MKKSIYLISLICLFSCKNETKKNDVKKEEKIVLIKERDGDFSKVQNLSQYPNTNFVYSLEQEISETKNVVYAATMPYAWQNIKNKLGDLTINPADKDLFELNKVTSNKNSLNQDEIKLEIKVEGNQIYSRAYFKKKLTFFEKLIKFDKPLKYKNKNVESFGIYGWPFSYNTNLDDIFNIFYYKNDDEFIINLFSKDKQHEIIIYKEKNLNAENLGKILDKVYQKIEIGKNEKKKIKNAKKYRFNTDMDTVRIPIYNFNIYHNYTNLEKKFFKANNKEYKTEFIYQRNAFILDEYGGIVESEVIDSAAAAAVEEIEIPKPKLFILNEDFIIIMKRKNSKNPYFVILNRNSELMKKFTQK